MANQASPNQGNQTSPNQGNQVNPNQAIPNPNTERWYFTKQQLGNTPSIKCGFDPHKELSYRQQAANFIQDMGQRLKVSQLCINTAIVYMHRFYVFHSFTNFAWHQMASAALFLAAKVEEQPRKLEYVIRVSNICRNSKDTQIDLNSERYINQSQDLVFNENVLLQTLGFDVAIDHPHTHVVRCCQMVRASKDLAQTSYFMASNSLHLTTMCIQYKPTVVACFCILVACKWSNWEIPLSNEGKQWYRYVDETVTADLLQQLTEEFLVIFEACPSRLKEKIMAIAENVSHRAAPQERSLFDTEPRKINREPGREQQPHRSGSSRPSTETPSTSQQQQQPQQQQRDNRGNRSDRPPHHSHQKLLPLPGPGQPKMPHGSHHRPPVDPKQMKQPHARPAPPAAYQPGSRVEPRDILRDTAISPFGIANRDGSRDAQKRDAGAKPEPSSGGFPEPSRSNYAPERPRADSKQRPDATKLPPPPTSKHESNRSRHESHSSKEEAKRAPPSYPSKPTSSSSQPKTKSPYTTAPPVETKPTPRQAVVKPYSHNGGVYSKAAIEFAEQKTPVKEETGAVATPAFIKRPSLFSPDQTPHKREPSPKKEAAAVDMLSPLKSPAAGATNAACGSRSRNASSSSEPELRPVMKKIDQVEGFENLMRDTTIGMDKVAAPGAAQQVPDVITPVVDLQTETVGETPDVVPLVEAVAAAKPVVNGLETNPAVISNWLKEAANAGSHLPAVAELGTGETKSSSSSGGHHHKSKKKNKDKHKHKDKSRDERDKKKKHKEKDREKHRDRSGVAPAQSEPAAASAPPEPIKIKIQKDKIVNEPPPAVAAIAVVSSASSTPGLKIKIPKNKINSESISELSQGGGAPAPQPSIGIKLKIPKEKLSYCPNLDGGGGKKRDRDRSSPPDGVPPHKVSRPNKDYKTNGSRHSSSSSGSKVAQMGGGETSTHRLAESKYTHKSSTS